MSGVSGASRIVVKIGSSSLTREDGGLDLNRIDAVARLVSRWRGRDRQVVIVSSRHESRDGIDSVQVKTAILAGERG